MNLEVGMLVRTKDRGIAKIKGFHSNVYSDYIITSCGFDLVCRKEIIKASHNIIDLIEVGDYVNGAKVDNIILKDDKEICFRYKYAFEKEDVYTLHLEDIETIVTKEQFESMSYKVKE